MKDIGGAVLGWLGAVVCTAAGVYLLIMRSGAAENAGVFDATAIDVLSHAIGVYFVGKGFAIGSRTLFASRPRERAA